MRNVILRWGVDTNIILRLSERIKNTDEWAKWRDVCRSACNMIEYSHVLREAPVYPPSDQFSIHLNLRKSATMMSVLQLVNCIKSAWASANMVGAGPSQFHMYDDELDLDRLVKEEADRNGRETKAELPAEQLKKPIPPRRIGSMSVSVTPTLGPDERVNSHDRSHSMMGVVDKPTLPPHPPISNKNETIVAHASVEPTIQQIRALASENPAEQQRAYKEIEAIITSNQLKADGYQKASNNLLSINVRLAHVLDQSKKFLPEVFGGEQQKD